MTHTHTDQADPIERDHWPSWLVAKIRQAIQAGKLRPARFRSEAPGDLVCDAFRGSGLFDHWGSCGELFVVEPVGDPESPEIRAAAAKLAQRLGIGFAICGESDHPGRVRVAFSDPSSCDGPE